MAKRLDIYVLIINVSILDGHSIVHLSSTKDVLPIESNDKRE